MQISRSERNTPFGTNCIHCRTNIEWPIITFNNFNFSKKNRRLSKKIIPHGFSYSSLKICKRLREPHPMDLVCLLVRVSLCNKDRAWVRSLLGSCSCLKFVRDFSLNCGIFSSQILRNGIALFSHRGLCPVGRNRSYEKKSMRFTIILLRLLCACVIL